MKRSKPPQRKTPLKRTPLKRGPSKKARQKQKSFKQGITGDEACEICGQPGTDADHILKRSQRPDLVGDPQNRRILCRSCHQKVTDDPDTKGLKYEMVSDKIYRPQQRKDGNE